MKKQGEGGVNTQKHKNDLLPLLRDAPPGIPPPGIPPKGKSPPPKNIVVDLN